MKNGRTYETPEDRREELCVLKKNPPIKEMSER
jgi:hypothetical protein